jgi:two-component system, LytTR family, sensor kinase
VNRRRNHNLFSYPLYWHILFWIAYVFINTFAWGFADNNSFQNQFIVEISELPIKLLVVYVNLFYLIPELLLKGKRFSYFAALLLCYCAGTLLLRWTFLNLISPHIYREAAYEPFFKPYRLFKYFLFNINFAVIVTTIISLFSYWYQQLQVTKKLTEEKHLAEIKLLKSQINPHFLFNTLNSLYSLALVNDRQAPDMILKLSDMMRYMIYDAADEQVLLKEEIGYLQNYVAIEKMRYGPGINLSIDAEGCDGNLVIAPLLLLPFVENIFKHAFGRDPDHSFARISFRVTDSHLFCKFVNNLTEDQDNRKGFGIRNVKDRLQLTYPGKHSLNIEKTSTLFLVELSIELKQQFDYAPYQLSYSG